MLKQLFNIPSSTSFILACSGGVDSMAVADFYRRGGKNFTLAYFNHGTPQAELMGNHVYFYATNPSNSIPFVQGRIQNERPKNVSPEEHWRNERYNWLKKVADGRPIVTCHHLSDVCETYLFSALHGNPKIIAHDVAYGFGDGERILRPFLTTAKQDMIDWCLKHNVSWFEDESNKDVSTPRNRIRHNIMKEVMEINPGIQKVMKKKVLSYYEDNPIAVTLRNLNNHGVNYVSFE